MSATQEGQLQEMLAKALATMQAQGAPGVGMTPGLPGAAPVAEAVMFRVQVPLGDGREVGVYLAFQARELLAQYGPQGLAMLAQQVVQMWPVEARYPGQRWGGQNGGNGGGGGYQGGGGGYQGGGGSNWRNGGRRW